MPRDLIVQDLRHAGLVGTVVVEPGMGATSNGRNGGGDRFVTDGKADVIVLNGG